MQLVAHIAGRKTFGHGGHISRREKTLPKLNQREAISRDIGCLVRGGHVEVSRS
jgi:hypothetical protein